MVNAKEIEQTKRRLAEEAKIDNEKRTREATLAAYARKSNRKMRKSNTSKKAKVDIFAKGLRLPGAGFSKKR